MNYSTVHCSIIEFNTVQYSGAQYSALQYITVQCSAVPVCPAVTSHLPARAAPTGRWNVPTLGNANGNGVTDFEQDE